MPLAVVSPHVIVGFADGRSWIHCGDSGRVLPVDDPALLGLLAAFARPKDPEAVTSESADPAAARRHVAALTELGALWPAGGTTDRPEPTPGSLVEPFLAPLAVSLDGLAATLSAVGPEVAESIRKETGVGLEARLMACLAAFMSIQNAVGVRVPGWIRSQLERLHLPERGLSIHLGAGSAQLDGWVNIDVWPSELALDFRWGLPFAEGSAERVYLSHTLEHLPYPTAVMELLRDIHRVLTPGGKIRIVVPDIGAAIQAYVNDDRRFFEGRRESAWPEWSIRTRMESFLGYAGVGPHPGMFGLAHKFGYDFETVSRVLADAGFSSIARSSYQESADPMFRVDHVSSYAGANVDGRYYSLFVEATR
jgi:predicted SAM-dependent methyltransferase